MNYRVALSPSRIGVACVVAAGAATWALALYLPFAPLVKAGITLWIALTMLRASRIQACEIVLESDEIDVRHRNQWRHGRLRSGSFVAPWLTIIRWRPQRACFDRTIVVLPDMLDHEAFRRLRVQLKWAV